MIHEQLHAAGLPVFPCGKRWNEAKQKYDKWPVTPPDPSTGKNESWRLTASRLPTDPALDWSSNTAGVPVPKDILVFDEDTLKGFTRDAVEQYLGCTIPWDAARIQNTVSGGVHYAFYCPWYERAIQGDNVGGIPGFDTRVGGRGFICTGDGYTPVGFGLFRLAHPESLPALPDAARAVLEKPAEPERPAAPAGPVELDAQRIIEALAFIDPDCSRDEWVRTGLALKHAFKDDEAQGEHIFDQWSAGAYCDDGTPATYNPDHIPHQWGSFKPDGGVTVATLFYKAIAAGWQPPAGMSVDTAAAFAMQPDVYEQLVARIRRDGHDVLKLPAIVEEIKAAGCSGLQAALLAAEIKQECKDKTVGKYVDSVLLATKTVVAPVYLDSTSGVQHRVGGGVMSPREQQEHFKDCVYVKSEHAVLTSDGELLRPERLNAVYGGYAFVITPDGKTTRKAFEAFTESQILVFPQADSVCFRPSQPAGHIVVESGRKLVNTYVPVHGERRPGDVSLFTAHAAKLLPDPADQEIFLSYLAACVQRIGDKLQWCPVLVGAEGNGKTVFYRVLSYALGERYAHLPNAADITGRFNSWIDGKLLIGIEELHTSGRLEVADTLKPLITNSRIEIQAKGIDQRTGDNFANFLIFSNHKDAVLKTENDRRYAVFYTAQQEHSDLQRDGMDAAYFAKLYSWLEQGGYAHVAHYLATRPVTVDVLGRAPRTSTTDEAIRGSMGVAEQLVLEAIELDTAGFRGDLISTTAAAEYLANHGKRLSPQRLGAVLESVGFIRHPGLASSAGKLRVNGQRHRLYVKRSSLAASLSTHQDVADAWLRANDANPFVGPSGPARVQPIGPPGSQ